MGLTILFFSIRHIHLKNTYAKYNQIAIKYAHTFGGNIQKGNKTLDQLDVAGSIVTYVVASHYSDPFFQFRFYDRFYQFFPHVKESDEKALAQKLLEDAKGFAGQYHHVVVSDIFNEQDKQHSIGRVKIGFAVPGMLFGFMGFGRGYFYIGQALLILSLLLLSLKVLDYKLVKVDTKPQAIDESELTWLEHESGQTEPIYLDEHGRSWRLLLPDGDTSLWEKKGSFYTIDGDLVLLPWGTNLVRSDIVLKDEFILTLNARKLAGQDGFMILFTYGGHDLVWVLGGWNNSKSELAGYDNTSVSKKIDRGVWYHLELKADSKKISGLVDGEKVLEISKNQIDHSSPTVGFKSGLGLAVWSSLSKFSDIRFFQ